MSLDRKRFVRYDRFADLSRQLSISLILYGCRRCLLRLIGLSAKERSCEG